MVGSAGFLWTSLFWFRPALGWPVFGAIHRTVDVTIALTGLDPWSRWVVKSALFTLAPTALLALGWRPTLALVGTPRRRAWTLVLVAYAASIPFLILLAATPGAQNFYLRMIAKGIARPVAANGAVLVLEHVWIFGTLLQLALPREAGRLVRILPAIVVVAIVFGCVHAGKDAAELWLAFPGGFALALLTWWTRSVWPGVVLHAATSATILIAILAIAA